MKHVLAGRILAAVDQQMALNTLEVRGPDFKTAKGSVYQTRFAQHTERVKAQRPGHPDFGQKKPSELTVYLDKDDAKSFGDAQQLQGHQGIVLEVQPRAMRLRLLMHTKGAWRPLFGHGPKGYVPFRWEPAIGLAPLELFDFDERGSTKERLGFINWHPGNPIVEIEKSEP